MNLIVSYSDVEILDTPALSVTIASHPFGAKARVIKVRGGLTIAELVEQHWEEPRPCAVTADGVRIRREDWGKVIPRESVEMVGVPQGFVVGIIAAISQAFSALFTSLAGLIPGVAGGGLFSGLGGKLLSFGLSLAARYILNALFAPSKPQLKQDPPTYSIGGSRNEITHFGPVPVVLGKHRVAPRYAAQPYTENIGNDQYLRSVFCWGHGPLDVEDIRIGETPLSEFEGVEIETRRGYPDDPPITLYPGPVFPEGLNVKLVQNEANVRTTADDTDEVVLDFVAPMGLAEIRNKSGKMWAGSVTVRIEYRPAGTGNYTLWQNYTISDRKRSAVRRSVHIKLPRGKYDFRVTRTSVDRTEETGKWTYIEALDWTGIRSIRNEDPFKSDVPLALTATRIKASSQLSGYLETFNGIVTSRVKSWNGSTWVDDTPSNNPADLFRHVLQSSANKRPQPDSMIDLDQLAEWHEFCDENGYTFNQVRDFSASVWETLRDIAAAGRAMPTFVDGKWSVVWDDPDAPIVQYFTPANSSGFTGQRTFMDEVHGWRVRFINEKNGYLQDERIVYDDGYDKNNATKFEGIEFPGVTDPDQIWKLGRYHIAQLKLRRETYELNTDWEHLVCSRGDRVRVTHDVPKWGLGFGRVRAIRGRRVALTDQVAMEEGKTYVIRFRLANGSSALHTVVNEPGVLQEITLAEKPGEPLPEAGDLYQFGLMGSESVVLRVQAIQPGPDFSARLTLVDDAPAIYQADQGAIPPFDPQISEPMDFFTQAPTDLRAVEELVIDGGALVSQAALSWVAPAGGPNSYLIQYQNVDSNEWSDLITVPAPATSYAIRGLMEGAYRFRIKAAFSSAISRWSAEASLVMDGPDRIPDDVSGFRATISGDSLVLSWEPNDGIVTKEYELRFAPRVNGVTWEAAAPLAPSITGTSFSAPYARGTYLIKAISHNEIYSRNATIVAATVVPASQHNVVETQQEDPTWAGSFDRTVFEPLLGGVRLSADEEIGYYYFSQTIDLGEVFTVRAITDINMSGYQIDAHFFHGGRFFSQPRFFPAVPDDWRMVAEIRYTSDDPVLDDWSEWEPIIVGDYTGRAFQMRLRLESLGDNTTPLVTAASLTIDMPDRIVADEDVESTTNGVTISFDPPFRKLKALNITGQELQTGDYHVISGKGENGFTVTFFNASNQKINRTFDYQAIGYGAVIE